MSKTPFYLLLLLVLISCNSESSNTTNTTEEATQPAIPVFEYTLTSTWDFDAKASKITWNRILDQKATKKKVKLFGAMVDVEMGPVKMDMSGNVVLKEGGLTDANDVFKSGFIVFDMAAFRLAREEGNGIFDVKKYPNSTLEFLSFTPTSDSVNNYKSMVKLTIQEHSEEFEIPVSLHKKDGGVRLKSKFAFNTLDFPLRDNTTKKEVNKDEITVKMDLNFGLTDTKKDSVRTN